MNIIKRLLLLIFVITFQKIYAYDYAWEVEYEIKNKTFDEINQTVWEFVYNNPKFHVYILEGELYQLRLEMLEPYKLSDYATEWMSKEGILTEDIYKYPMSVDSYIYLSDVDAAVHFFLIKFATGKTVFRLDQYWIGYEFIDNRWQAKKDCKGYNFNDVEPTKKEIPIKESFEKNFLSKLPLEWEYEKPAAIDRFFSKFLSLFRKRKNFVD